ncbi:MULTISPECIES: GntR family transcriptional regulator [Lacrimispora]|uniref:FadR/GntR family transcriptional regulator n=1 Tax=Lacrimispora TaxID=2719231 RepID=UPI000BE489A3|nr:GntR family transcriptional regulator [Lacrimispora amygdalina]MDK2966261.1 GntR family transcriptional regulator, transcriptional repressor for pyruvate dehydrogenase complex [Lacrimispora sp.]
MEFQKLSSLSLKEMFIRQIRDMILSGRIPVGGKLPSEREIAKQMQVSRAVVNSGFAELEKQGFLEILPRQGVFVANYGKNGNINTLNAIMEYHGDTLGQSDIYSIIEVRRALEHLVTDSVIKNASNEEILGLEGLLEEVSAAKNIDDTVLATFSFHHKLSVISKNSIIPLIYISFKPVVTQLWKRFCLRYGKEALYDSVLCLYKCIKERDAGAARRCTNKQLDEALEGGHQIY